MFMGNSPFRLWTPEKTHCASKAATSRALAPVNCRLEVLYSHGAERVRHLQNVLLFLQMLLKEILQKAQPSTSAVRNLTLLASISPH
jgi:hypothetical protein